MRSLPRRLRTFLALPGGDKLAWAESLTLFWLFRGALRFVPFRRFKRLLGPAGEKYQPARPTGPIPPEAATIARWMRRIAKRHPDTCLAQALTARMMLRRRNLPSTVSFGVRHGAGGEYQFHAWVAQDHRILTGGGPLGTYSVISTHHDQ